MTTPTNAFSRRAVDGAPSGGWWFEAELGGQQVLLGAGAWVRLLGEDVGLSPEPFDLDAQPACLAAAATLLRRTVLLPPPPVRPYFAVCALQGWRRVQARQLAGWSGIPMNTLKRRLATARLTPAGVAAWNLALHAAWLLDVAELPAGTVVSWMRLGRGSALGAVLGARGVRYAAGRVEPGAFAATLDRYAAMLRAAFPA